MMEATTDMQESLLQSAALTVTLGGSPSQARPAGCSVTHLVVTLRVTCSLQQQLRGHVRQLLSCLPDARLELRNACATLQAKR